MVCLGDPHGTKRSAKRTAWIDIKLLDEIDLNYQTESFNQFKFYVSLSFLKAHWKACSLNF